MADKFQSIFDDNVEAEKQFDTMFGSDEDDKLIEAVLAVNEGDASLPDFDELHQTDEESKPKDLADELGPDHDANKPTADSSDQEIISDDDDDTLDLACPKFGVQDGGQKTNPDNTDITDEIEKSEGKLSESLQSLLDEAETDLGDNEGLGEPGDLGDADGVANDTSDTEELTDNEDKNETEEMKEPVEEASLVDQLLAEADEPPADSDKDFAAEEGEKEGEEKVEESTSLVDQLLAEAEDPEQSVDAEYTDPEDGQGDPDINNKAKAGAEGTDKDPVYESTSLVDQLLAECGDPECSVDKEYTDPEDGQGEPDVDNKAKAGAEGTDKDPVYECGDDGCDPKDAEAAPADDDNSLVEALLAEAEDELPEEVEDAIIDDATDDSEMSDEEVDDIDDVYDDDLLDDVAGED